MNIYQMLWAIRHEWPKESRYLFNTYKHWSSLIIRDEKTVIIHIKEGVTQGDPSSMLAFGIFLLKLIQQLQTLHPTVVQTWYANYEGVRAAFEEKKIISKH